MFHGELSLIEQQRREFGVLKSLQEGDHSRVRYAEYEVWNCFSATPALVLTADVFYFFIKHNIAITSHDTVEGISNHVLVPRFARVCWIIHIARSSAHFSRAWYVCADPLYARTYSVNVLKRARACPTFGLRTICVL